MSKKFEAVKIKNPLPSATGWEVKTKQGEYWFTVCDTFSCHGETAEYWAKKIARMLNQPKQNKEKA